MSHDPCVLPRRRFLEATSAALGGVSLAAATAGRAPASQAAAPVAAVEAAAPPRLRLVLAQWSLQRMLLAGELDPLDFPRAARRQFGLDAVAYGGLFLKGQVRDTDAIADLARRADDEGVAGVVLTCDGVGRLGDPDDKARTQAVENHFPWVEAAKRLGCPAIRVEAAGSGPPEEQRRLLADGIGRLAEYAAQMKMTVLVANHGQPASDAAWLAGLVRAVGRPDVAALPDVGSFADYDRYLGMEQLAPVARGLTATAHEFDNDGEDVRTNYRRLLRIAVDGGYRGWLAIAYAGKALPEPEGVRTTKRLLERIRRELVA